MIPVGYTLVCYTIEYTVWTYDNAIYLTKSKNRQDHCEYNAHYIENHTQCTIHTEKSKHKKSREKQK